MTEAVPRNLLGCPMCSAFLPWVDDFLTLKPHQVGNAEWNPECPASGMEGIDLGPMDHYRFRGSGLVFVSVPRSGGLSGWRSGVEIPVT